MSHLLNKDFIYLMVKFIIIDYLYDLKEIYDKILSIDFLDFLEIRGIKFTFLKLEIILKNIS